MKTENDVKQQVTTETVREIISAVFDAPIGFKSLTRGLDALAHVCLLSVRLRSEIARLGGHYDGLLDDQTVRSLDDITRRCAEAETGLWRSSTWLREVHIVKILLSNQKDMDPVERLVKVYFPSLDDHRKSKTSAALFDRAMPDTAVSRLQVVKSRVCSWLEMRKIGESLAEDEAWDTLYGPDAVDRAVVGLMRNVDTVLNAITTVQRTIDDIERRRATGRLVSEVRPDIKIEEPPIKNPAKTEINDSSPHIKSAGNKVPPPNKKRSRPSLPPREGPDYTKPLPVMGSNVKRQRLHPFQTKDLK